jgi:hypothetical protein
MAGRDAMNSPDDPLQKRHPDDQASDQAGTAALIAALDEGEQSGPPMPFDFGYFL